MAARLTIIGNEKELKKYKFEPFDSRNYLIEIIDISSFKTTKIDSNSCDAVIIQTDFTDELCEEIIRPIKSTLHLPILVISHPTNKNRIITAVECGLDDFSIYPVEEAEIEARLEKLITKPHSVSTKRQSVSSVKQINDWKFDIGRGCLYDPMNTYIPLTGRESAILTLLIENAPKILDRDYIMQKVAGRKTNATDRSLDVSIGKIRKKLNDDPIEPTFIKTIRGGGYLLIADVTD